MNEHIELIVYYTEKPIPSVFAFFFFLHLHASVPSALFSTKSAATSLCPIWIKSWKIKNNIHSVFYVRAKHPLHKPLSVAKNRRISDFGICLLRSVPFQNTPEWLNQNCAAFKYPNCKTCVKNSSNIGHCVLCACYSSQLFPLDIIFKKHKIYW